MKISETSEIFDAKLWRDVSKNKNGRLIVFNGSASPRLTASCRFLLRNSRAAGIGSTQGPLQNENSWQFISVKTLIEQFHSALCNTAKRLLYVQSPTHAFFLYPTGPALLVSQKEVLVWILHVAHCKSCILRSVLLKNIRFHPASLCIPHLARALAI